MGRVLAHPEGQRAARRDLGHRSLGRSLGRSHAVSHPVAEERPATHGDALNGLRAAIAEAPTPNAAAQRVVELLHDRFAHYDWVGIYWVDGTDLVLGPWIGPEPTEHTRIPIGTGVCGAAAASGTTEIVPAFDEMDALFLEEVAALVAPLRPHP